MNEHTCPVCGYDALEFPPRDYSICACCGTEFGYDDRILTHEDLRRDWFLGGYQWFDVDAPPPANWDPVAQLRAAGLIREDSIDIVKIRNRRYVKHYDISALAVT